MKNKILLSSILTIVLCLSLFTGATFALFTSEDTVNISVTSGKIEAVANVTNLKTYSMDVEQEAGKFELGGTAKFEGEKLVLDRMVPGDKVTFEVTVENNSNVAAIYRFLWNTNEDGQVLMSAMNVTINSKLYGPLKEYSAAWKPLGPEEAIQPIKIELELPTSVGNEFQNLTTGSTLKVEVVQGNAGYTDAEKFSLIKSVTEEKTIADLIEEGAGSILLPEGTFTVPSEASGKTIELVGNGNTVIDATKTISLCGSDVTLTNVSVTGSKDNYLGYIDTKKVVYNNCIINDGLFLYADEVEFNNCEFNLTSQYIWTYAADKVSFNNCVFNTEGKAVLVYNEGAGDTVVNFKDCEFYATKSAETWDKQHVSAIELDARFANMTVNLEGNMIVDADFNGIIRIKDGAATGTHAQTGLPTEAVITNNSNVTIK